MTALFTIKAADGLRFEDFCKSVIHADDMLIRLAAMCFGTSIILNAMGSDISNLLTVQNNCKFICSKY